MPGRARMGRIRQQGRVVLGRRKLRRSIAFDTEALGMALVNVLEDRRMAFLEMAIR
jgi:hypothetical protein